MWDQDETPFTLDYLDIGLNRVSIKCEGIVVVFVARSPTYSC